MPGRVDATMTELGFRRLPGRKPTVFSGQIFAGKIAVPVEIEIPDWDFVEQPVVRLKDYFLDRSPIKGHLSENNVLCYSDDNLLLLDRYQPAESIRAVLDCAKCTLNTILHGNVEPAIQAEITAYWKGERYFLIDDPRRLTNGCIAIVSWGGNSTISVIGESEDRLDRWCKNAGATYSIFSDTVVLRLNTDIPPPPRIENYAEAIAWVRSLDTASDTICGTLFASSKGRPPAVTVVGSNGVVGFAPRANDLIRKAESGKRVSLTQYKAALAQSGA